MLPDGLQPSGGLGSTERRTSLDTLDLPRRHNHPPQPTPMPRNELERGILRAHPAHQDAAVAQTCVPLVDLKGDSYRLRDRDLGGRPPAREPETA